MHHKHNTVRARNIIYDGEGFTVILTQIYDISIVALGLQNVNILKHNLKEMNILTRNMNCNE